MRNHGLGQGPLITDGRNSFKLTYHCVGIVLIIHNDQDFWSNILKNTFKWMI